MSSIDRHSRGPSWIEVILGAVLSLILGVVIGALLLVVKPVIEIRDTAKAADRDPQKMYFTPGNKDGSKGRAALAKRESFVQGQSVTVIEDELNALAAASTAAPAPVAGKAPEKPAATTDTIAGGPVNFRIRNGTFQVGVPVTVSVMGVSSKVIVQSQGGFAKEGEQFAYVPETFYIGALPLQKLPMAAGYVRDKFLSPQTIPADIQTAWAKLANVSVEGNALKLTMP